MSIKDQWVMEAFDNYGKVDPKGVLRDFVGKLGIKSARQRELELRLKDIQAALSQMQSNFGQPDQVIMSPQAMKNFQKAFSKKP